MKYLNRLAIAVATAGLLAGSTSAMAAVHVKVTLFDQGAGATMATDLGMTMGGDKSKTVMKIAASPPFARAGEVTFDVVNNSQELVHEMLLIKVADQTKPLPYIVAENRVNEELAGSMGEVSELDPGKSGSLTLTLDKGTYMLFCNLPGHYMAGMWTLVTVK